MVLVCLPSDALSQDLPSYLGLSWTWGISLQPLQQSAAAAPYLGRGVSPHGHPSWPWMWSSSSRPSWARAAAAPWRWGCAQKHAMRRTAQKHGREELPLAQGQGRRPRAPGCDSAGAARRSYPTSEARGGGQEALPHAWKSLDRNKWLLNSWSHVILASVGMEKLLYPFGLSAKNLQIKQARDTLSRKRNVKFILMLMLHAQRHHRKLKNLKKRSD